jgi:hypothetical protein
MPAAKSISPLSKAGKIDVSFFILLQTTINMPDNII